MSGAPVGEGTWVRGFFGGRNTLRWEDLQAGTAPDGWAADVLPWVELQVRDDPAVPIVLPCRDASGAVTWYGAARTEQTALRLAEELVAHVGSTYADFSGRPHAVDVADDTLASLAEAFVEPVFRICPTLPGDIEKIRRAIRLYRGLVERRPPTERLAAHPLGILRSRFDRALLSGNEPDAQRLFEQILATGRLGADNRLFLEIRLYAGLGLWQQIAENARLLRAAADLVLPPQVRVDLVEALYRIHVEPGEESGDAAGALAAFRDAGVQRFERLFTTRQGIERPRVVKAFLVHALLRAQPNIGELESLCNLLPDGKGAHSGFTAALRDLVADRAGSAARPRPSVDLADRAFEDLDYDRALALYATLPPSRKVLGRLLVCASVIRDHQSARIALEAVDSRPEDAQAFPDALTTTVEQLRELVAAPVGGATSVEAGAEPSPQAIPADDWLAWIRWLVGGAPIEMARQLLDERSATWTVDALRADPTAVAELARLLGNTDGAVGEVVQHAFPRLFHAFVLDPDEPARVFKPLYATLLTLIAMAETLSHDDLELARVLVAALLNVGVDEQEYRSLVLDVEEVLERQRSLATFDWALDTAEVLAVNPAPEEEVRLSFIMKVLGIARSLAHRLGVAQMEALRLLCQDIDIRLPAELSEAIGKADAASTAVDLNGQSVAIYTLTEAAGQRAREVLRRLFPSVTVWLNSDHVCSERLAALAERADIFIFAWKSSKHQAYYCVKNHRPADLPLLMPRGKGSASILHEVLASAEAA
jgi:hypothetical protein